MSVTAIYSDGSIDLTTDYTVTNGDNLECGEQTIIIQYNGNSEKMAETIVEVQHLETIDQLKEPTCTETGLTEGVHCSACGEILTAQEEIPAKGHTEVTDAAVEATCTEAGVTEGAHCSVCKEMLIEQEVVPAKGHSEIIDAAIEPTCTEAGVTEGLHCSVCRKTFVIQEIIPALDHNYEELVTSPTCTAQGYTTHTCTRCTDAYVDTYTDALGHSFTNYVSNDDATCTKDGTETAKCDRCDETDTRIDIESALGHNQETTVTSPTCTEQGYTTHSCTRCTDAYVDTFTDALGHNYQNGTCANCGEEEPRLEITTEQYDIQDSYISKIQINTTVGKIKENLTTNATEVKIYNKDNQIQDDTNTLATGMRIEFNFNNKMHTYTIVVKGDTSGDGRIKLADMSILNQYRLKKKTLEGAYLLAADVTGDGEVDFKDLIKINRFRLNKITEL